MLDASAGDFGSFGSRSHANYAVRNPLQLTAERLDGHHHAREGVLLAEDGGEGATNGLKGAAREDAEQPALAEKEASHGPWAP